MAIDYRYDKSTPLLAYVRRSQISSQLTILQYGRTSHCCVCRLSSAHYVSGESMVMATSIRNDTEGNDVEDVAVSTIDPILVSTKRVVFVGGLPQATTVAMIRAATIPFGNIQSIDMVRSLIF